MSERVAEVRRNGNGNIIAVKTDAGQIYRLDQAVLQIESGNLEGVQIVERNGELYIRSYPDGLTENNLDNLPSF